MKEGTLRCWLFGHLFLSISKEYIGSHGLYNTFQFTQKRTPFCVRCGITREELNVQDNGTSNT